MSDKQALRAKASYIIGFGNIDDHGTVQTCNITTDTIDELMELIDAYTEQLVQEAILAEMKLAHDVWLTSSLVDHMNKRLAELKGGTSDGKV